MSSIIDGILGLLQPAGVPLPVAQGGTGASTAATAMAALGGSVGVNQSWTDLTGTRTLGATNTNSTGKPIFVSIALSCPTVATNYTLAGTVGAVQVAFAGHFHSAAGGNHYIFISFIVPNGATYSATAVGAGAVLAQWSELS